MTKVIGLFLTQTLFTFLLGKIKERAILYIKLMKLNWMSEPRPNAMKTYFLNLSIVKLP